MKAAPPTFDCAWWMMAISCRRFTDYSTRLYGPSELSPDGKVTPCLNRPRRMLTRADFDGGSPLVSRIPLAEKFREDEVEGRTIPVKLFSPIGSFPPGIFGRKQDA